MLLKEGLYEQLINKWLTAEIEKIDIERFEARKEKVEVAESDFILSNYLQEVVQKSLKNFNSKESFPKQVDLCNELIQFIVEKTGFTELLDYLISSEMELLLAIISKINTLSSNEIIRPISPLSQSSLFTGATNEPSLASEIKKEILSSDRIDILVSFIKWSGIRIFQEEFKTFTNKPNTSLRLITTSYMGATDYKAVEFLATLPNTTIKVSYDTNRTRLHAKAYLFYRDTGFTTAYIGSSNLSNPAMTSGLEWNIKVTAKDSLHIVKKFEGTFATYWNDKEFVDFNIKDGERLRQALLSEKTIDDRIFNFTFDIQPYSYQLEILEKLEAEREIHNKFHNLIVAATGTGKTVISAFDYKQFVSNRPNTKNRLLFVAHREEILKQSLSCFRTVLKDQNFGQLLVGNYQADQIEHLFISIQSFNSKKFTEFTTLDFYDFIIIDEFHHYAAPTYQEILSYYKPKILLGLTATPERMDGRNILDYFDGRIAAEIRLPEAIDRKLLCPFQYFGITDNIALDQVQWRRGGYDVKDLESSYLDNDERNRLIIDSLNKYVNNIHDVIGLGFCVSVEHAKYMAKIFNECKISAESLSAHSDDQTRQTIQQRLKKKEINFIFVVDIYNEGVEYP